MYAMNDHDRHRIRTMIRMRVICTFYRLSSAMKRTAQTARSKNPKTVASLKHPKAEIQSNP